MDVAVAVHALGKSLRAAREFDLANQLTRAGVSVPANIAEGRGRGTPREFARFCTIALGSLREVETLLILIERLGLAKAATVQALLQQADEVGRVLFALERSARNRAGVSRRPTPTSDV